MIVLRERAVSISGHVSYERNEQVKIKHQQIVEPF